AATVSSPISVYVFTTGGSLTGAVAAVTTGADVDLTGEGLADWTHWGRLAATTVDRKAGVVPQIGNFSLVGTEPAYQYADNYNGYSWTDGTPARSATNTPTGVYVAGRGNGFQLTVPADPSLKTLRLYVGTYGAQGRLRAYVSDFTAPLYMDESLENFGNGPGVVYTLNYSTASPGQTLIVNYS